MVKRKRRKTKKPIIQRHHITYDPEWVVPLYKGEHWLIGLALRRKRVSKGFLTCLEEYIRTHKDSAVNLG